MLDWMRGVTAGFLAGLIFAIPITLFAYIVMFSFQLSISNMTSYVTPDGTTITSGTIMYVLPLLLGMLVMGPLFGSALGLIFASMHESQKTDPLVHSGWKYGVVFGLPYVSYVWSMTAWVTSDLAVLYTFLAVLASVLAFGSLLIYFWNQKLYFHGYWGLK